MTRAEPRSAWALAVSLAVHGALLATVALVGSKALDKRPDARDVWSGDTLIVTDLMRAIVPAADARRAEEPPPVPAKTESANVRPAAAPHPAAARTLNHSTRDDFNALEDPNELVRKPHQIERKEQPPQDLAARIFAYHPPAPKTHPDPEPPPAAASTMGAAGAEGPPRQLARAFARAIPAANTHDPIWDQLPLGDAGSVIIDITVDGMGAISDASIHEKPQRPPPYLEQFVNRTLLALKGGRFVLTGASRGTQTIRVDVTVLERAIGAGPLELGFETPRPGHPGRGYFQLESGRFVDARVAIQN